MHDVRLVSAALLIALGATSAETQQPQAGWKVIVRIVPNPLPLGRCAAVRVEVQDDEGYQSFRLTNGAPVDSRTFKLETTDAANFRWQNDKPTDGYLCADAKGVPGRTTVRVTLPDGLVGDVALTSIAPGQAATPVSYPPQGLIRIAGRERVMAAARTAPSAMGAPSPAALIPSAVEITTTKIAFTGAYFLPAPVEVRTPTISFAGAWFAPSPMSISTARIVATFKVVPPK